MKNLLLVCGLLLAALPAAAQTRTFPPDAPRGYLNYIPAKRGAAMLLNDKPIATSPGLQIRDQRNLLIFPHMVPKDSIVKYQLENKYLHRVWIMTKDEIARPDKYKLPNRLINPEQPHPLPGPVKDDDKDKDEDEDEDEDDTP